MIAITVIARCHNLPARPARLARGPEHWRLIGYLYDSVDHFNGRPPIYVLPDL